MTSQTGIEPLAALHLQVGVQALEVLERGDGHQEVPASIPHQTFHLPLIISLARTAKPVIEQVVGLQLGEHPGPLTAAISQYPGHRQGGVVVQNALGHPAQKCEGGDVSITEGLGGLRWIRLHVARIAVREIHGQVVGFLLRATDDHPRFAEVTLGVPWRMCQRARTSLGSGDDAP